ncbi:MAG: sulfotransferase, partial [Gammaproteobacteria bacterium]
MMKTTSYDIDPIFIVGVGRSGTTMLVNLLGCHPLLSPIYETSFLRNMLLLCEWASWYWGHSLSRSAASVLFGYPRSRFVEKCKKFQQKGIQFRQIVGSKPGPESKPARGKQKYETFPFTGKQLLFPLDALIEESEALSKALQARPLKEEEIYALARSSVDRLFGMHCARATKPYWVNKTPRLLLCLELLPKLYPSAKCIHIVRDGRDVATSFRTLTWGPKDVREAARRW